MTPATIQIRRVIPCPNGCRHEWTVDHLFVAPLAVLPGQTHRKVGPWSCHVCGESWDLFYDSDTVMLERTDRPAYRREFVLLELPPQYQPVRFKLAVWNYDPTLPREERTDRATYFYEEHTCPTNWMREVVEISVGENSDPHGLFRFVGNYDADGEDTTPLPVHPLPPPLPSLPEKPCRRCHVGFEPPDGYAPDLCGKCQAATS